MALSEAELLLLIRAKNEASQHVKQVDKDVGGLGKTLGDVGKIAGGFIIAQGITAGVSFITGQIGQSIKAAVNLGESLNAVNQIFGDASQKILDWGDNNANAFGLSQRAFNQMATPMGAVLQNLGFSQDQTAEATINLTKRAADMASVFNTDVEEALAAINSALRGEGNPIERYGVSVNQTAVNLRAMADSGKKSAEALTENEKAAARLALIFEQTAKVEGDFAATSDQVANATRIQQARMEELQATIGEKLIPIQLKLVEAKLWLVEVIGTKVIPYLEVLYAKHYPALRDAAIEVYDFIHDNWPTISAVIEGITVVVEHNFNLWMSWWRAIIDIVREAIDAYKAVKGAIESLPDLPNLSVSVPDINPFRATGGPTSAGRSYIVGERGPEWFTPGANGYVSPMGSGATIVNNFYGNFLDGEDAVIRIIRDAGEQGRLPQFIRRAS